MKPDIQAYEIYMEIVKISVSMSKLHQRP